MTFAYSFTHTLPRPPLSKFYVMYVVYEKYRPSLNLSYTAYFSYPHELGGECKV